MVKDFRVEIDGEDYEVDSPKEAAELADEKSSPGDRDEIIAVHIRYTEEEWVATLANPDMEYEGRADRKWGAVRELIKLVDERAQRFGV
jgi:hypothetical protein